MITIEVKVSDYRQPGSWDTLTEADSVADAEQIVSYLQREFRREQREGLLGAFERWEYRIAPQAAPVIRCIRRKA